MMFCAVLMTLCRAFLSAIEQPPYHTERQYVQTLSVAERQKATSSFGHRWIFFRSRRKCKRRCAFLTAAVVFADQERLSNMWTPRNLKLQTLSTQPPFMKMEGVSALHFLKSKTSSLVFFVFSDWLFSEHHYVSFRTFSPPEMSPITVVSFVNFVR